MIQVGRLRSFYNDEGKKITFFKTISNFKYKNLRLLFDNIEKDLKLYLKEEERENLFYTVAHHMEGKRTFQSWVAQDIIPIDLDGINLDRIDEYPALVGEALDIDINKCAIVYSGNGCHILIQVALIKDKDFIKNAKLGYRQLLERIEAKCEEKGLPLDKDTTAWDYARILRVPFTLNKKIKKDEEGNEVEVVKECTLVQNNLEEQTLEIPIIEKPAGKFLEKGAFPSADVKTIVSECRFFSWLKEKPEEVHEPHAYAMLSITGHFDDENKTSKEYWDNFNSPSINSKNLAEFTEQALTSSGPRTCEGINELWEGCSSCPHYQKVTSPIMLKDESFIGTAARGFTLIGPKGGKIRQYEDLRKYYSLESHYIHITDIKRVMVYKEGLFVKTNDDEIKGYAQKHFYPTVEKEEERKQFLFQVKANPEAQVSIDYIHGAKNEGLVNLSNGVYDVFRNTLLEHGPQYGFIYKLPYEYDSAAKCPIWEKLLGNLTLNRQELIDLIEESIAYTIFNVPYTTYQHYFLLTGGGSNGKTTFINIFKMLLGKENTAAIKLSNLLGKEYYIAELEGKLANMVADEDAEAFEKKGADSTLLKALTGGDTVTARVIYEGPMQFINRAKFFYAFNNIPRIGIKSHGDIRRPIIIPFDANLDKSPELKIEGLYENIEGELSGIFNRIIEAYKRLNEHGFTKTSLSYEKLKSSRLEHDSVYEFLSDSCEVKEGEFTSYNDLFDSFDSNDMYQNENFKLAKRTFCKRVRQIIDSEKGYDLLSYENKKNDMRGVSNLKLIKSVRVNRF